MNNTNTESTQKQALELLSLARNHLVSVIEMAGPLKVECRCDESPGYIEVDAKQNLKFTGVVTLEYPAGASLATISIIHLSSIAEAALFEILKTDELRTIDNQSSAADLLQRLRNEIGTQYAFSEDVWLGLYKIVGAAPWEAYTTANWAKDVTVEACNGKTSGVARLHLCFKAETASVIEAKLVFPDGEVLFGIGGVPERRKEELFAAGYSVSCDSSLCYNGLPLIKLWTSAEAWARASAQHRATSR